MRCAWGSRTREHGRPGIVQRAVQRVQPCEEHATQKEEGAAGAWPIVLIAAAMTRHGRYVQVVDLRRSKGALEAN